MILASFALTALMPLTALFCCHSTRAGGLRVLAVHTISGKSHWNFMNGYLHSLTDSGHRVTVFTWFADGPRANYTETVMAGPKRLNMDLVEFKQRLKPPGNLIDYVVHRNRQCCDSVFSNAQIKSIMAAGGGTGEFDVIVTESLATDCMSRLVRRFRLPLIYLFPSPMPTYMESSFLGQEPNAAYVSNFMMPFGHPKSFRQRLLNFLAYKYSRFLLWYVETAAARSDPRPYDRVEPVKPSLVFVNSHFVVEPARPKPPNFIEIGGIHLPEPKPIPNELKSLLKIHRTEWFTSLSDRR